jgi:CheY-like chemotaxis protein
MDMHMPLMDGYAATRAIRARPAGVSTPIVAFTASAFEDAREAIFQAGATGWLRKPCRESQLLEEIRRQLGIEYQYAAQPARPPSPSRQMLAVRPFTEGVPPELVDQLLKAARIADYQRLNDLIEELPAECAGAAEELSRLVGSYAYDRIETLLRT